MTNTRLGGDQESDARLILLHVVENLPVEAGAAEMGHLTVSEYDRYLEEDAVARLKSAVPEQARLWSAPDERVTRGRAYREILKVAKVEGVELIVMGVQGKGALSRLVFGSTTHHVSREAVWIEGSSSWSSSVRRSSTAARIVPTCTRRSRGHVVKLSSACTQ